MLALMYEAYDSLNEAMIGQKDQLALTGGF
jgi:hypothetical protein